MPQVIEIMVGAGRFELPTPSPPDWCANQAALRSARPRLAMRRHHGQRQSLAKSAKQLVEAVNARRQPDDFAARPARARALPPRKGPRRASDRARPSPAPRPAPLRPAPADHHAPRRRAPTMPSRVSRRPMPQPCALANGLRAAPTPAESAHRSSSGKGCSALSAAPASSMRARRGARTRTARARSRSTPMVAARRKPDQRQSRHVRQAERDGRTLADAAFRARPAQNGTPRQRAPDGPLQQQPQSDVGRQPLRGSVRIGEGGGVVRIPVRKAGRALLQSRGGGPAASRSTHQSSGAAQYAS